MPKFENVMFAEVKSVSTAGAQTEEKVHNAKEKELEKKIKSLCSDVYDLHEQIADIVYSQKR